MKKSSKKIIAATMAATMIAAMGNMGVMAQSVSGETTSTESTQVKYAVTAGYEWSIHSEIDFGNDAGVKKTVQKGEGNTVSVTKNIIPDGKKLQITVAGSGANGAFTIANGSTTLNYTIKKDQSAIESGGTVLDVAAGTNTGSKNLTFTLTTTTGAAEVAGNYTGTVTYTASVVDQSSN